MIRKYNLSHRLLVPILLLSLFLQSCLNSPIASINLEEKHQHRQNFTNEQPLGTDSCMQEEKLYETIHTATSKALIKHRTLADWPNTTIMSSSAEQFSNASSIVDRSSSLTTKKIAQEKRMPLTPRKTFSNFTKEQVDNKKLSYIFKIGPHKRVKIYQQGEKWEAKIKEELGVFRGNPYVLSVYFELGMDLQQLATLPQGIQKQYIHINQDHVYIGRMGLLGGGKDEKNMNTKKKEKKKSKGARKKRNSSNKKRKKQEERKNTTKPRKKGNEDKDEDVKKAASKRRKIEEEKKDKVQIQQKNRVKEKEKMTPEEEERQEEKQEIIKPKRKKHRQESDPQIAIKCLNRTPTQGLQKPKPSPSKSETGIVKDSKHQQSASKQEIRKQSNIKLSNKQENGCNRKRKASTDTEQTTQLPNVDGSTSTSRKKRRIEIKEGSNKKELDKKMVRVGLTDIPKENFNLEYRVKEKAYSELLKKDILPYLKKKNKNSPTCFISYVEGDSYHEQWVERFCKTLKKAGIVVSLDRWIVKNGNISTEFVKRIKKADWVLVVGTKLYLEKCEKSAKSLEEKEHIVRLQVQLINHLISHSTAMGDKVIPILLEGTSEESLPYILHHKIAADFTINDYFEELLKLIRDLYKIDNVDKKFEIFIKKFNKYSLATARITNPEERERFKAKYTAKILESDQKILNDIDDIKEEVLNKSESSSDESPSDKEDGRQSAPRTIALIDSTPPRDCQLLHNDLLLAKLEDYIILRKDKEEKLSKKLNKTNVCVVYGHGGTGKSTLVAAYGHKQQNKQVVWWIPAETSEKLITSYTNLAKELQIDYQELAQKFKQNFSRYLAKLGGRVYNTLKEKYNQSILLILDNASNPDLIASCLLSKSKLVQVVVTTRDKEGFKDYSKIKLSAFTKEEGKAYIHQRLQTLNPNETDIKALINQEKGVGLIPQKLKLATAYIRWIKPMDIEKYLEKLRKFKRKSVLPEVILGLETLDTPAQLLLRYSSYLDPDFIPLSLITHLLGINDKQELDTILSPLKELSLITTINSPGREGIQIHQEIQTACKNYQDCKKIENRPEQELIKSLLGALDRYMPPQITTISDQNWSQARLYATNAAYVLSTAVQEKLVDPLLADLIVRMGNYNRCISCNYEAALKYHKQALEINKNINQTLYNGNHPDIATSLNNIGMVYKDLGKNQKALKYIEQANKMWEAWHRHIRLYKATQFNNKPIHQPTSYSTNMNINIECMH